MSLTLKLLSLVIGKRRFGGPCDGQWKITSENVEYIIMPVNQRTYREEYRAVCSCGWSSQRYWYPNGAEWAGSSHAKGRKSLFGFPPISTTLGRSRS